MRPVKPNPKILRDSIRASVPDGKLREAQIVLSDKKLGEAAIGGFTQYERGDGGGKVIKIGAPSGDNAFDITVRGHETRHAAKHKPTRKKPMTQNEAIAGQIVDDVNAETLELPRMEGNSLAIYRRAHLATAANDLRTMMRKAREMKRGGKPDDVNYRNGQLLCAVRTLAMHDHYAQSGRERNIRREAFNRVREICGTHSVDAIRQVIKYGRSRRMRALAIDLLVSLMETAPSDFSDEEVEGAKDPLGDILAPPTEGTAFDGRMTVINLRPKNAFTSKEKQISTKYAPDGVVVNPSRFVSAIVSGDANGLFSRRVRQKPGGTVLIDASGSMGANSHNLTALCKLIPTATVAYYSGRDGAGSGDLCIYALEGKRFSGELPNEHMHGGNAIDLPAVRWLLRLPKPWYLVSDLGFCGGNLGAEAVAHALVARGKERGDLKVLRSLDAAFAHFGGKTPLRNREEDEDEDWTLWTLK